MLLEKEVNGSNSKFYSLLCYFILFTSSFLLAYYLLGGFQVGFSIPLSYSDDGLFVLVYIKLLLTGHWNLSSSDVGYPFGMNLSDFPGSDFGNRAFFIFLSLFTKDPVFAFNLYAYLSFPITACVAFFVSNKIGLKKINSVALSGLFAFSTFSLQRLILFGHLVYMFNFVVPIFYYLGYLIYKVDYQDLKASLSWKKIILFFLLLILLSSFGVYYAFFGCLVIITSGILGSVRFSNWRNFFISLIACLIVLIGFLINMIPTIINSIENGKNNDIAVRSAGETDIYGLRLTQMLLPHSEHRLKFFRDVNKKYSETFTYINENKVSAIGLLGGCGFLLSMMLVLFYSESIYLKTHIRYFSVVGIVLFIYGTVGGLGSFFSFAIVPIFRGLNRISIFVSFSSLIVFFQVLESFIFNKIKNNFCIGALTFLAFVFGIFDQTFKIQNHYTIKNKEIYFNDNAFVKKIEKLIGPEGAVFQFPYMAFPEVPPAHQVETYGLARGYINSISLKWNYGAIKGRLPDAIYKVLLEQSVSKQLELIKGLGFDGIYIDRRGFIDKALQLEKEIQDFFNCKPEIVSSDNNLSFFLIPNPLPALKKESAFEYMKSAGMNVYRDNLGIRIVEKNSKIIDFKNIAIPSFIKELKGLSYKENWGQWSDASKYKNVYIKLDESLSGKIELIIFAKAFGPNVGVPFIFKIGNEEKLLTIGSNIEKHSLEFEIKDKSSVIEIFTPMPTSPQDLGVSNGDFRKLGIGIQQIIFMNNTK